MGTINFVWWNLQNFFDTDDDPISRDFEYTAEHGWTEELYRAKRKNLAEALNATHDGEGPELLTVAEIEKDEILEDLIQDMGNPHLKVVKDVHGTSDLRGIDVTMAYDTRKLKVISHHSHIVHLRYRTRDLFEVEFELRDTGETFIVIAGHWPSRRMGKYRTEPLRIAVAEHVAYLVESHVKFEPEKYDQLKEQNKLEDVRHRWESKVLVTGDFNDTPAERSVQEHLKATNEIDRVIGNTNNIDGFEDETGRYRAQDVFLYNATWNLITHQNVGTYFLDTVSSGEKFANRYQIIDQLVVTRGFINGKGLQLDKDSVDVFRDNVVATRSGRPRSFNKKTQKGTSDHLPVVAKLSY